MSFDKSFDHNEKLLDAALTEFAEHGYEQASINTILSRAGMSKGQFYYHFQNKEGLYFALVEVLIARKREFLAQQMGAHDFHQDLFTILRTQIRHGLAFAQSHRAISRFSESFTREQGNPIYARVLERFNFGGDNPMAGLIAQAYNAGQLRTDLPLPFIQRLVTHLFTHAAEVADLSHSEEMEQNLDYLITFLETGLVNRK